ncbi:secondary thiamine-phosphate synthase enzyme YjbQ [bacterium]|nr:secondary thiamine-phosphate synthase enzyme YjbQ [bacterium]
MIKSFTVRTPSRTCFVNVTRDVAEAVRELGLADGAAIVYIPHTTAAVTINESADPDVVRDLVMTLNDAYPERSDYLHAEGNSDAHMKSALIGCSELVLVADGELVLGTWQGVFFCEFDGPRTRKVHVSALGARR